MSNDKIWFLGYGSNMDKQNLVDKKGVTVYDYTPAVLRTYRLSFNLKAIPFAEPFFANCEKGEDSDEIHGIAFQTDHESVAKLDKVESGYDKAEVVYDAYDGRKLSGFVYVKKAAFSTSREEGAPSGRYLKLLINGAKKAGLRPDYVARLESNPFYKPDSETLAKREAILQKKLPLKKFTKTDLGDEISKFVSVFGVVFFTGDKGYFGSHRGQDITARNVRHYLNLPLDGFDQLDEPGAYPDCEVLKQHQDICDYVWTWFDHYAYLSNNNAVARLEYFEASQNGKSSWKYPL